MFRQFFFPFSYKNMKARVKFESTWRWRPPDWCWCAEGCFCRWFIRKNTLWQFW